MKKVVISYAHEDVRFKKQLVTHLALLEREGMIDIWSDDKIGPGDKWEPTILKHLESADIIVLFVSPNYLASKFSYETELDIALKRNEKNDAKLIPVLLQDCDWKSSPLSPYQMRPLDEEGVRPIARWGRREEAWAQINTEIRRLATPMPTNPGAAFKLSQSSRFELLSKGDPRRVGIAGRWSGIVKQPMGPEGTPISFDIALELRMEEHIVVGTATYDYQGYHTVCSFRGGFIERRFLQLDYTDMDPRLVRDGIVFYGTIFCKLSTDQKRFDGHFLGYATETNGLVWGEVNCTRA